MQVKKTEISIYATPRHPLLRRLMGLFLLVCLTTPFTGTYLWLTYQQHQHKEEVKSQLAAQTSKDELVLLKFTPTESQTKLRWEHSREFEYNGQMYDIVETSTRNDTIYYWCWWDHEETKLNRQLTALLANESEENDKKKEHQERVISFYYSLYHADTDQWQSYLYSWKEQPKGYYFLRYVSPNYSPPVPPPRRG